MKGTSSLAAVALAVSGVAAFPSLMMNAGTMPQLSSGVEKRQSQGAGANPPTPPPFNAAAQYVSTTGQYAFVPPGPGDIRGECPGLNAMANHGYLPHNGQATSQQFIDATNTVFGMAYDLGGFLAYYGSIIDGNGAGWNIGGVPHTGILGSHGNYETDSSPIKSDLNQYGTNTKFVMSQFMTLYNSQPNASTANYNLEVLRDFRGSRFVESVNKNPYFTYNPFDGILVSQAAFTFIYRFMSNKSAQYPEGILNKNVLKSFMAVTGPENNLTHTPGYERIPDNWYKRNQADEYSIPYFFTDIGYFGQKYPFILEPGCNQGKVNSYNAIDPSTLSGGAYSFQSVAQNPGCFALQFGYAAAVSGGGLNSSQAAALQQVFANGIKSFGVNCTNITNPNFTPFSACPGATFYGGPTGPVAPGAIQS